MDCNRPNFIGVKCEVFSRYFLLLSERMTETERDVITDARPIGEFPDIKVRFLNWRSVVRLLQYSWDIYRRNYRLIPTPSPNTRCVVYST